MRNHFGVTPGDLCGRAGGESACDWRSLHCVGAGWTAGGGRGAADALAQKEKQVIMLFSFGFHRMKLM